MRFLADENFPRRAIQLLRQAGHDVLSGLEAARGADDAAVLRLAQAEQRVVLTFDKDFGELAFRAALPAHSRIVLFRLQAESAAELALRVLQLIESRTSWAGLFAVVEAERVRVRPLPARD